MMKAISFSFIAKKTRGSVLGKRLAAVVMLLSVMSTSHAGEFADGIQDAMIKYLAKGRNFTLAQPEGQALGVAYVVPQAKTVDQLEGLLNTGETVALEPRFEGQMLLSSFAKDQQYQLRRMYAEYIAAEIAPLLQAKSVDHSEFVNLLASSGVVFTVYREKLQQPLDSFGIGIVKQPDNYVAVATQSLSIGGFTYYPEFASKIDALTGEQHLFQKLASSFSKHEYTLADERKVRAGDVLAIKLELGRIMDSASIAQN